MKKEEKKEELISKIVRFIPTVEKPKYKQPFITRFKWTALVLILYLFLSFIPIFGVKPSQYEQFRFFEIVMGSKFGSLITLGIGPIVTAGIILQLLVGSKIIDWDLTKPEDRKKFEAWDKLLAVAFCFIEGAAYVISQAIPTAGGIFMKAFVAFQLALGGLIVILLDDIVSKWGIGSGVSLFIAAGVSNQIFIRVFSFFPPTCRAFDFFACIPSSVNPPSGLLWKVLISISRKDLASLLINLLPILSTIIVFLLVVYMQDISIEIPLVFGGLRGFGRSWSLKLLYTSNIPVILAAALLANLQLMGRFGLKSVDDMSCSLLACYDRNGRIVKGILYYLTSPRNLLSEALTGTLTKNEIIRAFTYLIFLTLACIVFSIFWVNTSGMDPKSVSEQLTSLGMQIPGYRRDAKVIESVLERYIPKLAVLGGLFIGLLAAFADFLGAVGTGTGILLTVMILYNYYEQISAEKREELPRFIRKFLGE